MRRSFAILAAGLALSPIVAVHAQTTGSTPAQPSEKIVNLGICSAAFSAFEVISMSMPESEGRNSALKGVVVLNTKLNEAIEDADRADFDKVRMAAGNKMLAPFAKDAGASEEEQTKAMEAIGGTVSECRDGLFKSNAKPG